MKSVFAAYLALVAFVLTTAIVFASVHDMRASERNAMDNKYLAAP
jgi:hypothetical protein